MAKDLYSELCDSARGYCYSWRPIQWIMWFRQRLLLQRKINTVNCTSHQCILLQLKIYAVNCVTWPVVNAAPKYLHNPRQHWLSSKWNSSSWVCHDTAKCLEVLYVDIFLNIFSRLLKENTPVVATEIQNSLMGNVIEQGPNEEAKTLWCIVTEAKAYCSLSLRDKWPQQIRASACIIPSFSLSLMRYDMIYLLSHPCGPFQYLSYLPEDKGVKKCNPVWNRGQQFAWANGNSATFHVSDVMPFLHLQVAEAVFVFLKSHWHT